MTDPASAGSATPRRDLLGLVAGGEGAITGTVVCAAVIAYAAGHVSSTVELCAAILGTVLVYWLAHLHAATLGSSLTHRHHPVIAFRHAVWETLPIIGASIAPVLVLIVSRVAGADLRTSAWIALFVTIGLLTVYSYLAGARGGLDTGGRIASAAAGAALGILVALLKVALH
jgi:ABC-type transport system involved in multi-copper enzyme maturation permease subunit